MIRVLPVLGCLCGLGALAGAGAPAGPPPGWDRYQAIMWSTGAPRDLPTWFARLKEIGCTAEEAGRGSDPGPFAQNRFGFYVENLEPGLGFLNQRHAIYDEDYRNYTGTHDRGYLVRKPCLDDDAFWAAEERRVADVVRPYVGHHPLLYDLRDELSIGSFASPMDYCFCPLTLSAFRDHLRQQYRTLDALNAEWESHFPNWEAVAPLTTYEIKEREREALAGHRPENYAPWADHRAYMDLAFARTLERLRRAIRNVDPVTPVGIEGTQMPSAWGGYDLWRLSQAVDWVEPYDIASSREIFRSFLPDGAPVLGTVFGSDFRHIRERLWHLLLHGDRGCILWDDEQSRCIEKDRPEMPVTERGRGLAPILAELKRVGPELMRAERVDDGIAVHYSQASIRAHWMFDSREDGSTWPRRLSSYEASHSRLARVRDSFVRVAEDLGLQYRFVSSEQLERGDLLKQGYRALLLPQSVAMSAAECEQVRAFARAGGTVIADNMTATMDEHCRRLPKGQLDELFGIRRGSVGWRPEGEGGALAAKTQGAARLRIFEPDVILTGGKALLSGGRVPAAVEHAAGKGRAIYLNLDMHAYGRDRLRPPSGEETRGLFQRLLAGSGIAALVRVVSPGEETPVPCVEVWRYRGQGVEYVAVMRNPEFAADSLGPVGHAGNEALEKPERIRILLAGRARIRDVRSGKDLGTADRLETALDPWSPVVLALRPAAP